MPHTGVRFARPRPWIGLLLGWLAGLMVTPGGVARQSADPQCPPPVPADLLIAPEDEIECKALSHFAWGLFLHLQDEAGSARVGRNRRAGAAPTLQFNVGEAAFPPVPDVVPPAIAPPVPGASGTGTAAAGTSAGPAAPAAAAANVAPVFPEYIHHYREALKQAPDNQEILQLFAGAVILAYDAATLQKELQAFLAADPGAANVWLLLAELQFRERQADEACKTLEKGIEADNWHDVRLVRQLCDYLVFEKQQDKAEKLLLRAKRKAALKNDFNLALATALFYQEKAGAAEEGKAERDSKRLRKKAGQFARDALALAEECTAETADFGPDDGLVLVRVFYAVQDYARALKVVTVCRALFPEADGEFDVWEAESLLKLGRKQEAANRLAALEKRAGATPGAGAGADMPAPGERRPRDFESIRQFHMDNINLGRLLLEMEKPKEAVAAYERALRIAPADHRLRFILGQLYLGMKQPSKTLDILAPVTEMPQRKHLLLSHAYFAMERMTEAGRELALAEDAARKADDPTFFNPPFYLYYATVCEESGLFDRAVEKSRKALELAPNDPEVQNFLGYVLADHDRELAEAHKLIEKAARSEPRNAAFLDSMAWVLYREKRFDDALDWIRRAIRYSGDQPDPVILDHAGDICAALGMWEEAKNYWGKAIAAGDKHPEKIQEKLRKIPALPPALKTP